MMVVLEVMLDQTAIFEVVFAFVMTLIAYDKSSIMESLFSHSEMRQQKKELAVKPSAIFFSIDFLSLYVCSGDCSEFW